MNKNNKISVFSLVMITVIAVDSLRSIPLAAQYGFSLVFYYVLAAIMFLIPAALVSAELASSLPKNGGLYIWVREAFGDAWATFVIWLQWIYNICWYPTILAVLAASLIYPFNKELTNNNFYMLITILTIYWLITYINLKGIQASALLSKITAIIGTLLPMMLISLLGLYWLYTDKQSYIQFNLDTLIPSFNKTDNWIFLSIILYSLIGIEITGYHAQDVENPEKNFPKALIISTIIILVTIIASSLSVSIVVPVDALKENLIGSMLDAFKIFFTNLNMPILFPIICLLIAFGTLGGVGAWIIGPSKGLLIAADDGHLPKIFTKRNEHNAPVNILIIQGIIFSILSTAYIFMPNVNSAFLILSILTAQLAIFGYIFMFLSVIKLRHSAPNLKRPFKIPGGKVGLYILTGFGIISSIVAIILSFIPPDEINIGNYLQYEILLISSFLMTLYIIYRLSNKNNI